MIILKPLWIVNNKLALDAFLVSDGLSTLIGRFAPNPDPLLSASNKSGQKCLSAHFTISNNVSLRSTLVKFEAEPII
ncbi:hypothetical protein II582_02050 [bacterium]|nr:hypothetical protein [bacterium]